jgi:hypothetical protein
MPEPINQPARGGRVKDFPANAACIHWHQILYPSELNRAFMRPYSPGKISSIVIPSSLPHQGTSGFPDGLRFPQRLVLEIEPDLYERIKELSIRSGRSIPEIIQELISYAFPINPAETASDASIS